MYQSRHVSLSFILSFYSSKFATGLIFLVGNRRRRVLPKSMRHRIRGNIYILTLRRRSRLTRRLTVYYSVVLFDHAPSPKEAGCARMIRVMRAMGAFLQGIQCVSSPPPSPTTHPRRALRCANISVR